MRDETNFHEITFETFKSFAASLTLNGKNYSEEEVLKQFNALSNGTCIFCGAADSLVGVFHPNNAVEFGGIEGKGRIIFYNVCFTHTKNSMDQIEEKLKKLACKI